MIKKTFMLGAIAAQLLVSCSKEDNPSNNQDSQIATIIKTPYSNLTPEQQKVKLENEANSSLTEVDGLHSSEAIKTVDSFESLLNTSNSIDILSGKDHNEMEDVLKISGAYGIYTWDNPHQIWNKTSSTSELKFIFPADKNQLNNNNAVLSIKGVSSNKKIQVTDTEGAGYWDYNENTQESFYVETDPAIYDDLYLPSSAEAKLTVNSTEVATFTTNATYASSKDVPTSAGYKITLNNGYSWEQNGATGNPNTFSSALSHNGKNILSFSVGNTSNIDKLLNDEEELTGYLGTGNMLVKVLDNFVMVGTIDIETLATDQDNLDNTLTEPDYESPSYYTNINAYNKNQSDGTVAAFNKNMKLAFVSTKDGTKIADVVMRSEKGNSHTEYYVWNEAYGYWEWDDTYTQGHTVQEYDQVPYLKFNDNTEVSMEAYFSSGFTDLQDNFMDFLKGFN